MPATYLPSLCRPDRAMVQDGLVFTELVERAVARG
jgi:hypothetical protein